MVLIGRLTKDAVVVQLKDDRQVVDFSLAINSGYRIRGSKEWKEITTYYNCAYWLNVKVAEILKKGNLVEVVGSISVNPYKDMQGEARASLNCHVDSIKIHQQVKQQNSAAESQKHEQKADDLPF